jgi:putative acetyltransferase
MNECGVMIRGEASEDRLAIHRVNALAFERPNEARLVDALRDAACPCISLVAVDGERVVGHILFTPVAVESASGTWMALGLAPMAVLPECQRQGIGSRLVREGLVGCARQGHLVVVVLGHPHYYPRFGFVPAVPKGLRCEYPVPDEVFMVAELVPGALKGRSGLVTYRREFAEV